jgi:riboflavin kinase/FMN adenylyltransferase
MKKRSITGLDNVDDALRGGVLSIGNFDGVHLGHRRIASHARALADAGGLPVVFMTFDPPPDLVIRPEDVPQRVSPHEQTVELLLEAGADAVVTVQTNIDLLHLSPAAFIDQIILGQFAPRHMVEGPNFFFGRRRSGTIATLQEAGREHQFAVHVVEAVMTELDGQPQRVCSTLIRQLVREGRVDVAGQLLARPFSLTRSVVHGEKRGRVLEFPTANLGAGEQIVPADGVYAGLGRLGGKRFPAAISVGNKPTFGPADRVIEVFLDGADGEFYGQSLTVDFYQHLRHQEAFPDAGTLQQQIARDVEQVRQIVARRTEGVAP